MCRHSNNSKVKGIPVSKLKHFNRHVSHAKCSTQGKQIFHPPKLLLAVSRLPFLELYFAAVLSLVFCIFRTFLTIFCSSTKKARMILHTVVVIHKTTKLQNLDLHTTICPPPIYSPLPNSNSREYSTIRTVHSPAAPRQPGPFVLSRPQVRDLEIWKQ